MTKPLELKALLEVLSAHNVTTFSDGEITIEMIPSVAFEDDNDEGETDEEFGLGEIQFVNADGEPISE